MIAARRFVGGTSDRAECSFVMDSEAADVDFSALRAQAPERVIELAHAVQRAFYLEG
jgi:putative protein-disulfide isomerase